MWNKYIYVFLISGPIIAIDQVTKLLVNRHIPLHDTISVIPGFFNLTHVRNTGAAFGLLAGMPLVWRVLFFTIITLVALTVIGIMIRKAKDRLEIVSLSLIAAGAVGNLIDRLRLGEVVDFIQLYYGSFVWPSFNVADSSITIGVVILAILLLRKSE